MKKENTDETASSSEDHQIRELEQEVEIMGEYIALLSDKNAEQKPSELNKNIQEKSLHEKKESDQEKFIVNELCKSLEEKTELDMSKFLTMISHELKTPLVPIKAYAEMLEEGKFGEIGELQRQKLKAIDDNARELIQFVSNIVDYQKFSLGKIELQKERNDIKKIIMDAHTFFSSEYDSRGMRTNSNFGKPLLIICDATRMHQVLTNLLQIALYSTAKKHAKIIVNVWEKEKDVEISVWHNGESISQDDFSKILSKFYQVDTSNIRSNGGIGLSLVVCKQIIEAHGGKIWAKSDMEKGPTIYFTLPKN